MKNNLISQGLRGLASRKLEEILARYRPLLIAHPKKILCFMLICIILSVVCCFTILRQPKQASPALYASISATSTGGQGAIDLLGKLRVVMELQAELKLISAKHSLNKADSLHIERLLFRLAQIQNQAHEKDKP